MLRMLYDSCRRMLLMENFVTPLVQAANATKELYDSYISAGFNEDQAIRLTMNAINHSNEMTIKYGGNNE